jgi:hypothetical protein
MEPITLREITALAAAVIAFIGTAIALWAAMKARRAHAATLVSVYRDFNDLVGKEIDVLGPLTPYHKDDNRHSVADKRLFFLGLFNRWRFDIGTSEERVHVRFRQDVMGKNLSDFKYKIHKERGYEMWVANECARVLKEIHDKEPYYKTRSYKFRLKTFWDVYFPRDYFLFLSSDGEDELSAIGHVGQAALRLDVRLCKGLTHLADVRQMSRPQWL